MAGKLCILGCRNFHREIAAALRAEGCEDAQAVAFPARCGRPPLTWDELRPLIPADCSAALLFGGACLARLDSPPADFPAATVQPLRQCFDLVADCRLVDEALAAGAYLLTPSWLADWRSNLADLGFTPERAGAFFQDFAKELVLLDTGIDAAAPAALAQLTGTLGLPSRTIAVGLDPLRARLARLLLEWRLDGEKRANAEAVLRHAGQLADHVSAMDLLAGLVRIEHEPEAIAAIADMLRMLFAPEAVYYLKIERGVAAPVGAVPAAMLAALKDLREDYAWTADGKGFLLRIGHGDEPLACVAVDGLSFPEHRERYLNMALAITGICGLAIENTRNRRKLMEAEKLSSLGIMVAGVAHEINTPLGICLLAASDLAERTRRTADGFARRSMTQSDLESYLQGAGEATALLAANLDRIGHLVGAFRQVAMDGKPPDKRRFRLADCLDEVVKSLGDRLARVRLAVHCAADLEIDSLAGDWASILVNLISNSLRHGFKDGRTGSIRIEVTSGPKTLRLAYQDDGEGMAPEILAQIFTPFFTTDLQRGTGLGLYLVYNLVVHRLGGEIHCDSRPGQGVSFVIEVPL